MNGPKFDFSAVKVVVGEPNRQIRHAVKGMLYQEGFHHVFDTDRLAAVKGAVTGAETDLLICETVFGDGDPCALFHRIRHHELGGNPFISIIAITGAPTSALVARVIDSGADHLVAKPLVLGVLKDRMVNLVKARKPFVVTTDYIGPDRRKVLRPGTQDIPLIPVPNTFAAKATGGYDPRTVQSDIDRMAGVVNEQKMFRHSVQIEWLVDRILPFYDNGQPDDELRAFLDRLVYVTEDIGRRLKGTRFSGAGELCSAIARLAGDIRADFANPSAKDIRLLPEVATAIRRAFAPAEAIAEAIHGITESVAGRGGAARERSASGRSVR